MLLLCFLSDIASFWSCHRLKLLSALEIFNEGESQQQLSAYSHHSMLAAVLSHKAFETWFLWFPFHIIRWSILHWHCIEVARDLTSWILNFFMLWNEFNCTTLFNFRVIKMFLPLNYTICRAFFMENHLFGMSFIIEFPDWSLLLVDTLLNGLLTHKMDLNF